MAAPIDTFGAQTMDPLSAFGAETENPPDTGDNPLEEMTQRLGAIHGLGTLGMLPSDGSTGVVQPSGQGIGVGGPLGGTGGETWIGGGRGMMPTGDVPTGVDPGGPVRGLSAGQLPGGSFPALGTPGGATGPGGGDLTAGGGFNPVDNSQIASIFPTTIPVDPEPAGGRPEGGFFGNPIPVDPGPAGGLPEGGFFNQGPVGAPFPPDFVPPPETNPFPINLPGPPTVGPPPPGPTGQPPEGGIVQGPNGPIGFGNVAPSNPTLAGGGPVSPIGTPPANVGVAGGAGATAPPVTGNFPAQPPFTASPSNPTLPQIQPDMLRRLLAILAARQNRTA